MRHIQTYVMQEEEEGREYECACESAMHVGKVLFLRNFEVKSTHTSREAHSHERRDASETERTVHKHIRKHTST